MRTTILGSTVTPAPSAFGVEAALANLTVVITAARQQGSVDQEAEDLLHQAEDGPGQRPPGEPKGQGRRQDKDENGGNGKGRDAAKKLAELERKVDELINQARSAPRPPPSSKERSPN